MNPENNVNIADKIAHDINEVERPTPTTDSTETVITSTAEVKADKEEQTTIQSAPITYKEINAIKRSRYYENFEKFNKIYLLRNNKTEQIAEVRGFSSFHACNNVGWRAKHVSIMAERDVSPDDFKIPKEEKEEKSEA